MWPTPRTAFCGLTSRTSPLDMPPRSSVFTLPEDTREALDRRIMAAGFGGYEAHTAWLAEQGHAISESALKRYGKRLKRSAERDAALASEATAAVVARVRQAAEMARAINEAAGGDPLAVPEKTTELLMGRLYELAATEQIDAKTLQAITRSLNESLKTLSALRGERDEERRRGLSEAKDRAVEEGRRRGVSPMAVGALRSLIEDGDGAPLDTLRRIRRDVYGIHDDPGDRSAEGGKGA